MTSNISTTFLQHLTAHAIWDVVAQTYFDGVMLLRSMNIGIGHMRIDTGEDID